MRYDRRCIGLRNRARKERLLIHAVFFEEPRAFERERRAGFAEERREAAVRRPHRHSWAGAMRSRPACSGRNEWATGSVSLALRGDTD